MTTTFLIGGARSGKSSRAVLLANDADARGIAVTFIVTGEAHDDEMRDRIAKHQAERPPHWVIVEAPRQLADAVAAADSNHLVVIDCLSFWVANLVMDADLAGTLHDGKVDLAAKELATCISQRLGDTVIVTNEVGMSIVPEYPLGRAYRDILGRANATIAAVADEAFLVVAGKSLRLE